TPDFVVAVLEDAVTILGSLLSHPQRDAQHGQAHCSDRRLGADTSPHRACFCATGRAHAIGRRLDAWHNSRHPAKGGKGGRRVRALGAWPSIYETSLAPPCTPAAQRRYNACAARGSGRQSVKQAVARRRAKRQGTMPLGDQAGTRLRQVAGGVLVEFGGTATRATRQGRGRPRGSALLGFLRATRGQVGGQASPRRPRATSRLAWVARRHPQGVVHSLVLHDMWVAQTLLQSFLQNISHV